MWPGLAYGPQQVCRHGALLSSDIAVAPGPDLSKFGGYRHLTPWNRGVKAHERAHLCALCADHPFFGDEALQSLLFGPSNITGDVEQG